MDGTVSVHNVESGERIKVLNVSKHAINNLAFSPDNKRLVCSSDRERSAVVVDIESGERQYTIGSEKAFMWNVAFSPDGRFVAARASNALTVANAKTGETVATIKDADHYYGGSIRFSPSGDFLLGGRGYGCGIWEAATGRRVAELRGHHGTNIFVEWSRGGRVIASAPVNGSALLWRVEIAKGDGAE